MFLAVLSWLVTELLHKYFSVIINIPDVVWFLAVCILIGGGITHFLTKYFFGPITELRKAMNQVAQGDYSVRLSETNRLKEMADISRNFNRMAKELEATEILKTDFVSNVSHEIKTPVNAIEGYAMLLQGSDQMEPKEKEGYINKILFNTRRLSTLVGNILLLSKIDNQVITTNRTHFRMDEQIRQSIHLLEPEWEKKDIEFDVDLDTVEYTGNENLLLHVWNNLIGNAIKFNPVGGMVTLRLKKKEEEIIFEIEDTGPGISEEVKNRIFDKFYQADSSRKEEGNGLGLALVKQIVALEEGTVTVENLSGGGCRFTVILNA